MTEIDAILQRRTDLSTFLVHFTRDYGGALAGQNLLNILMSSKIEARNPLGMALDLAGSDAAVRQSQLVVSLSETPMEHAWSLCGPIDGRDIQMAPYGLAVTKPWARKAGCNPVMYLDMTPGHDWLTNPVNELVRLAQKDGPKRCDKDGNIRAAPLPEAPILQLTPFIEQMGTWSGRRKEFWWEREWRHQGDLTFAWDDLVAVFVPEIEQPRAAGPG